MNKEKILNFIKKYHKIIIISLIIIITLIFTITYISKNQTKNKISNETKPIKTFIPTSTPTPTPTISIPITCKELIEENSQAINSLYNEEPQNFFWLNENEKVEYIKGFSIYIENEELKKYYKQCLEKNFSLSDQNNLDNNDTFSYQRKNIKCHIIDLYINQLVCGTEIQNDENSQIVLNLHKQSYPKKNNFDPNARIEVILKKIDNFAHIITGAISGFGGHAIVKLENEQWIFISGTQDYWDCDDVHKHQIPPALVNNFCGVYNTQDYYEYNEDTKKWEQTDNRPY